MRDHALSPSPLDGIDIPNCKMALSESDGVQTFHVAFSKDAERGARVNVVRADADGVLHAFTRPTGDEEPAAFVARSTGDHRSDEALSTLSGFGIIPSGRTFEGVPVGDVAIEIVVEAERANPSLRMIPRHETVGAAQRMLLRAGLEGIIARIGPERLGIQALCDAVPLGGVQPRLRLDSEKVDAVHGAIGMYPALATDLALRLNHLDLSGTPTQVAESLLALSGLSGPGARTLLRQVSAGKGPRKASASLLRILSLVPRDWIPRDGAAGEWEALSNLVSPLRSAHNATSQPITELASPSRGRWRDFAERLAAASGTDLAIGATLFDLDCYVSLEGAAGDVADMRNDALDTLVRPLMAFAKGNEDYDVKQAVAIACRLLFHGRGLPRILEMSRRWHRMGGVPLTSPGGGASTMSWHPVLPPRILSEVSILPLASAKALAEEGARGHDGDGHAGLNHCVGSRWKPCMQGEVRVMAVRRNADGARLSTFEVRFASGRPVLAEHKGIANSGPPEAAVRAVDAYMADLASGALAYDAPTLAAGRARTLALRDVCGYDWRDADRLAAAIEAWGPYLPRPLRDLTPADFLVAATPNPSARPA